MGKRQDEMRCPAEDVKWNVKSREWKEQFFFKSWWERQITNSSVGGGRNQRFQHLNANWLLMKRKTTILDYLMHKELHWIAVVFYRKATGDSRRPDEEDDTSRWATGITCSYILLSWRENYSLFQHKHLCFEGKKILKDILMPVPFKATLPGDFLNDKKGRSYWW